MRAQIAVPVRRLLDVVSGAGPRVADPVRAAVDATAAGCAVALEHTPAAAAGLASVRCLDVLTTGAGRPGAGTTDPRLVGIAGERAAWNERVLDSWECVMPWQVRSEQQRRLVAGGYRVRVVLRSGAPVPAARRAEGRS